MNETIYKIVTCPRVKDISKLRYEVFVVLYNCGGAYKGNINYDSVGTPDYVSFPDINSIISNAKLLQTDTIVLLHNHPFRFGLETMFLREYDPEPSICDIASTMKFINLLRPHGIKVLDHLIVCGNSSYFSFFEHEIL